MATAVQDVWLQTAHTRVAGGDANGLQWLFWGGLEVAMTRSGLDRWLRDGLQVDCEDRGAVVRDQDGAQWVW
ncbi:hypothetical protein SESBI_47978 [Sesbania bispinosa]|nr:hypothetical protein SESBI_47978 [Sesbania bispinosa]